jgi:hypothetical protein
VLLVGYHFHVVQACGIRAVLLGVGRSDSADEVRASKAKQYASASVCGLRVATAILMGRSIRPWFA